MQVVERSIGSTAPCVQWYGAHPDEGSISMEIYRRSLWREQLANDRYKIKCWPEREELPTRGSRFVRVFGKYWSYPNRVSRLKGYDTAIVHLLDHSTGHLLLSVPKGIVTVVTLHDLIPLRFDGGLTSRQVGRFRKTVSRLGSADAVIAVSEYSRKEALDLLGLDPKRVFVVPNGVEVPEDNGLSCKYSAKLRKAGKEIVVLSVGSNQERKNLNILPGALRECMKHSGSKVGLLRVGTRLSKPLVSELEGVLGPDGLIECGRLDEGSLWSAYRGADVMIVPSLYEGYGLPVMEAFGCGLPVACSNATSLPEVGGAEAEYFSPDDPVAAGKALSACIDSLDDEEKRKSRLLIAKEASWRKHLEGVYQVYDAVLGDNYP